jgi:hypothetical protein
MTRADTRLAARARNYISAWFLAISMVLPAAQVSAFAMGATTACTCCPDSKKCVCHRRAPRNSSVPAWRATTCTYDWALATLPLESQSSLPPAPSGAVIFPASLAVLLICAFVLVNFLFDPITFQRPPPPTSDHRSSFLKFAKMPTVDRERFDENSFTRICTGAICAIYFGRGYGGALCRRSANG